MREVIQAAFIVILDFADIEQAKRAANFLEGKG